MNLKTYRASTIGDALGQIKKDLGRNAVILHTRTFKVGGMFGLGGRRMVEITAADGVNVVPRAGAPRQSTPADRSPRDRASPELAADRLRSAYGLADRAAPKHEPAIAAAAARVADLASAVARPPAVQPATGPIGADLERELTSIKSMVARVLSTSTSNGAGCGPMPEALMTRYLRLLEADVAGVIADEVVLGVKQDLLPADLDNDSAVHRAVLRRLAAYVPVALDAGDDVAPPGRAADGRPLTIALVGPTGVGKTTTVAKLAATYKLRHGKRVGLVTADTFRIAAVEQLRTYANIIGLPLRVVQSPAEMATACQALADCEVILIDTAGRSPHDGGRLEELRAFLDAARPHETHLVLSSAASEGCMIAAAERFAVAGPNHVIFTKLDEAVNFGVLVNVVRKVNARLSFITTGQEVPDKIEAGRADRLARLVLEGGGV